MIQKVVGGSLALFFAAAIALPVYAGDIDCAHPKQGPESECIERIIGGVHTPETMVGYVAYSAPRCDLLIVRKYEDGSFALVDFLKRNQESRPGQGYEIASTYRQFSRDFIENRTLKYRIGYDIVDMRTLAAGLTSSEAVAGYAAECSK